MGCIEFWAVNSLLGSAMFVFIDLYCKFIIFLVVEIQPDLYRYGLPANKDDSVVALVLAAITYGVLGVLLIFWKQQRERRMNEAMNYQALAQGPHIKEQTIRSTELRL